MPSGKEIKVTLDEQAPGRFAKTISTDEPGVHRIAMDGLNAIAVAGDMNAPEFQRVVATDEPLRPILDKSGGGAFFLGGTAGEPASETPSISMVRSGHRFSGSTWLGLKARDAFEVTAVSYTPLVAGFARARHRAGASVADLVSGRAVAKPLFGGRDDRAPGLDDLRKLGLAQTASFCARSLCVFAVNALEALLE